MKPGPKPKPTHLKKLRRSFRLSQMTVFRLKALVDTRIAKDQTEAIEDAVKAYSCGGFRKRLGRKRR